MTIAFELMGKTVAFTGATSAPTPVQCVSDNQVPCSQYVLTNTGAVVAYFAWGQNADRATTRAAIPAAGGASAYGYPVLPGTKEVITAGVGAYFTAITGSSTALCLVSPGVEK